MSHRVLVALRRLSPWMRSVIVAAALLLVLGVAAELSTPSPQQHRSTRPETTAPRAQAPPRPLVRAHLDLARARRAARGFLASYLRFAYGRSVGSSVAPISAAVRDRLALSRSSATPAERLRHPRVVSLQVVLAGAELARATALVEDGGITGYVVRVTLGRERSGWVVSAIGG